MPSFKTYPVLAFDLDVVDCVRPQGKLRPGSIRQQVANQAPAGYLPSDQALSRSVGYCFVPANVSQDQVHLALGLQHSQLERRLQILAALQKFQNRWSKDTVQRKEQKSKTKTEQTPYLILYTKTKM